MRHSSLLVLSTSLVVLLFCSVVHGMGIYGDKEPVESLYPYKPGEVSGASFSRYDGRDVLCKAKKPIKIRLVL